MKRNPNAKCGNCPYWKRTAMGWWDDGLLFGWCRYWPSKIKKRDTEWCGQHPDFWETVEVTETIPTVWPDTGSLYKLTSVHKKLNAGEMDLLMSDLNTLKNAILAFIEKHDEPKVTINHTAFTSTIKSHKYPEGTE